MKALLRLLLTKAVSGFKYMVPIIENLIIGLVIGLISTTICYNTIKPWLMIKIFPIRGYMNKLLYFQHFFRSRFYLYLL
jgi:hypothetical protein